MKLCCAQVKSAKGQIPENILKHKAATLLAVDRGAKLIVFPELSLTGYEPALARNLESTQSDRGHRLAELSSDEEGLLFFDTATNAVETCSL